MNKKMLLSLGGIAALSAAIITPVMLVPSNNSGAKNKDVLFDKAADTTADKTNVFDPSKGEPVINPSNAVDYLAVSHEARDPNKWYSQYRNDEYDNYDPEMAYKFAAKYGWSIDDYSKYVHYHYETTLDKKLNQFGSVSAMIASSWMAFHPDSGLHNRGGTAINYWPGHESPTRPTYDGSERVESNHVDNKLTWYGYKDSMGAFVFDQNNLKNAFTRLTDDSFKRLEYVTLDEVKDEKGSKNVDDKLVDIERSDEAGSQFVMVNGKLEPFSWFYKNGREDASYYYITANNGTYIRDENGWKVVVSPDISTWEDDSLTQDQAYDKLLTTVLNPINANPTDSTKSPVAQVKDPVATHKLRPVLEQMKTRFNNESKLPMITGGGGETIEQGTLAKSGPHQGQATFTENSEIDYGTYKVQNFAGLPKAVKDKDGKWDYDFKDISVSAQGVYKLAYKEDSWLDLVANRSFVMTYKYYAGPGYNIANKDRLFHETGELMWEGADMNWMWCEDGQGGHKIWKKINILTPRTWDEATALKIIGGDVEKDYHPWKEEVYYRITCQGSYAQYENLNPNHRFWANYNHIFWNKLSFEANPDASKDGGY